MKIRKSLRNTPSYLKRLHPREKKLSPILELMKDNHVYEAPNDILTVFNGVITLINRLRKEVVGAPPMSDHEVAVMTGFTNFRQETPDTGESGETYDVEMQSLAESQTKPKAIEPLLEISG